MNINEMSGRTAALTMLGLALVGFGGGALLIDRSGLRMDSNELTKAQRFIDEGELVKASSTLYGVEESIKRRDYAERNSDLKTEGKGLADLRKFYHSVSNNLHQAENPK